MRLAAAYFVATLALIGIAGCADQGAVPPGPQPLPAAPAAGISYASAGITGAIPSAQATAVLDVLMADLAQRLKPETTVGAVGVSRRPDGAPRVSLDTALSFETGSAQMRPETLLRLAESAAAAQSAGAVVVHVLGYGAAASAIEGESLAERRAIAVATYLVSRGLPSSRVRAEGRVTRDREAARRVELIFEPIVEGREVRAWMPPQGIATR